MNIYKAIFFFFPLFSFFFRRPSMVSRACTETMCGARHRRDDETKKKREAAKKKYMCNYEAFGTQSRYKCDYTFPRTQFSSASAGDLCELCTWRHEICCFNAFSSTLSLPTLNCCLCHSFRSLFDMEKLFSY